MKNKNRIILGILALFLVVPLIVHFFVSTSSPFGFISNEKQDVWISFYAALISGSLTLIGVGWTIRYTDTTRKEDLKIHEQELKDEYEKRNFETKKNLAAQYKPVFMIALDSEYTVTISGTPKYEGFYINNILSLNDKVEIQDNDKRISISLFLLNIGRGEARNLKIKSFITCPYGSEWTTEMRTYEEIYISNGLDLMLFKVLTKDEWKFYDNNVLKKPMNICIKVEYEDLVGFQHTIGYVISVHRFIHLRDERNQVIENVLVLNPYDTTIQKMTSAEE